MPLLVVNNDPYRLWGPDYDPSAGPDPSVDPGPDPSVDPGPDPTREELSEMYFTIEVLEDDCSIRFSVPAYINSNLATSVSYSIDNGTTWTDTNINSNLQNIDVSANAGDEILWKGVANTWGENTHHYFTEFTINKEFNIKGNLMSLLYGDEFIDASVFPTISVYTFGHLFKDNINLISSKNLILPTATAPDCYNSMFYGCTSLQEAPELPATTVSTGCYSGMFYGCTSLQEAPELPATTTASYCYVDMFRECTSLQEAPELLATTLTEYCYSSMFKDCTSLNYIKILASDLYATALLHWVDGVSATGTFIKAAGVSIPTGGNGIPEGWTVEEV